MVENGGDVKANGAGVVPRSSRAEVRNPLLALPAAKKLAALDPAAKAALRAVLLELRDDCRVRAEKLWAGHKAPMASYFKAVGVYANHTARLLKEQPRAPCQATTKQLAAHRERSLASVD